MSDIVKADPVVPAVTPAPAPYKEVPSPADYGGEGDLSRLVNLARQFLYRVVFKYKWIILGVTAIFAAVAGVQSVTTTPIYLSWIKIQIEPESSSVLPFRQPTDKLFSTSQEYVDAQVAILRSRSLALRLIERLNLPEDAAFNAPRSEGVITEYSSRGMNWLLGLIPSSRPAPKAPAAEAAASAPASPPEGTSVPVRVSTMPPEPPRRVKNLLGRFAGDIEAKTIGKSRMVEVSFQSVDPAEAARLVDAVVNEYIEVNFEEKVSKTAVSSRYLTQRQEEQKAAIEKSEQAALEYAKAHGIVDSEGRDDISLQTLNSLNTQLSQAAGRVSAAKANYDLVKRATPESFPPSLSSSAVRDVERRISGLKQQLATLTGRYGPKLPEVDKTNREIAQLEVQLRAEKIKAIEESTDQYETVLREQRNVYATLENQKRVAENLGEKLVRLKILRSDVANNRKIYNQLIEQTKQADISASLKPDSIRVIDRVGVPGGPFKPNTSLNLIGGLFLGLIFGIGLATVISVLDTTVKTPEELEMHLGLPSLGVVPTLRQLKSVEQAGEADASDEKVAVPDFEPRDPAVIPYRNMLSRAWEPYRSMRTAIMMSHSDAPPRVILITSSIAGEGKTVTAVNLGIVMAKTGARTLLMDLDMRKPRLSEMFGAQRNRGMSIYLSGNSEKVSDIVQTSVPNLFMVASGKTPPNSAELVGSKRMKEALDAMRQEYDFVILDSPPVLACTDGVVLSRQVDGVVLVVRGGITPRKAVEETAVRLVNVGGKILGVVMNDIDLARPEYSYYYGSYSQHYHQYYGKDPG